MGSEVTPQMEMPRYRSHKVVHALKIKEADWVNGFFIITPEEEGFAQFKVDDDWVLRWHARPVVGGYFVQYADGYTSWSPAKAFEEGYAKLRDLELINGKVRLEIDGDWWGVTVEPGRLDDQKKLIPHLLRIIEAIEKSV